MDTFLYKHVDGCDIHADFHPTTTDFAPLLVYIHGGGLIWGTRRDMNTEQIQRYNAAGFHVLSVDYRLAPESNLFEICEDIRDLLVWIRTEASTYFSFHPEQVAVVGSSAGGYLALLTGTFTVKPNAIVSFYGYGQVTGDWYRYPSPHFTSMPTVPKTLAQQLIQLHPISSATIQQRYAIYLYCRQQGTWLDWVTGSTSKSLDSYAPVVLADSSYPSTLLIHGNADEDVPYQESVDMKTKLDALGVPNELLTISNGKHNFDSNMNDPGAVQAVERTIQYLYNCFDMN